MLFRMSEIPGPVEPTRSFTIPRPDATLHAEWYAPSGTPKGLVVVTHGYAEHCGRYREVAHVLVNAGAAVRWRPLPLVPVQLQAGFHLQRLSPVNAEDVADGYTPFDDPFTVRRVELGISVGIPGALR